MKRQDIDRETFLTTIFDGLDPLEEAICLGHPLSDDGTAGWSADAWRAPVWADMVTDWLRTHGFDLSGAPMPGLLDTATHFSISTFTDTDGHGFRRRRSGVVRCFAMVLDDIGTKAELPDEVLAHAAWRMETSPGNEQVGFMIENPWASGALDAVATALASFAEAGMTDKGVTDLTRYVRLPGSLPAGKEHPARLVSWTPRTVGPLRLLDIAGIPVVRTPFLQAVSSSHRGTAHVILPGARVDAVEAWLRENDMVLQEEPDGWLQIVCPWIDEHGDRPDTGTKYKPLSCVDNSQAAIGSRAFKCWHSSCEHRGTPEFLAWAMEKVQKLPEALADVELSAAPPLSAAKKTGDRSGVPVLPPKSS